MFSAILEHPKAEPGCADGTGRTLLHWAAAAGQAAIASLILGLKLHDVCSSVLDLLQISRTYFLHAYFYLSLSIAMRHKHWCLSIHLPLLLSACHSFTAQSSRPYSSSKECRPQSQGPVGGGSAALRCPGLAMLPCCNNVSVSVLAFVLLFFLEGVGECITMFVCVSPNFWVWKEKVSHSSLVPAVLFGCSCLQVGGPACVTAIMQHSAATADVRDGEERTALMWAVLAGNPGTCTAVLAAGGSPDSRDKDGRSALHLATLNDIAECVDVLIRYRANLELADHANQVLPVHFFCCLTVCCRPPSIFPANTAASLWSTAC